MSNFIETASSRETSIELMEAILFVAGGNETEAERVWEDPTETEMLAIWERSTKNGLIDDTELFWGASGRQWASEIQP